VVGHHILRAIAACSAYSLLAQSVMPTIRVPVRLVPVPTLVFSNNGSLATGLELSDFRVLDNGRLQNIALDTTDPPVTVAIAIQVNQDVREYLPFISKVGSVLETLLVGESGEAAVITYADDISLLKPFDGGDLASAIRGVTVDGRSARMLDAGWRGLTLLRQRQSSRARFLILIGQSLDRGSETKLKSLKDEAETDNVTVFAVTFPEVGKAFVSDNFSLQGPANSAERGGFKASVNLGDLISVLSRGAGSAAGTDPFSELTVATGGAQFHVRKQNELEQAISAIGLDARSAYQLSYSPNSSEAGYHALKVEVDIPNAKVFSRPGYWRTD
jgi:VWFA-related protein